MMSMSNAIRSQIQDKQGRNTETLYLGRGYAQIKRYGAAQASSQVQGLPSFDVLPHWHKHCRPFQAHHHREWTYQLYPFQDT